MKFKLLDKSNTARILEQCIAQLESAALLRAGLQDSDSRRAEVQDQQRRTLVDVASKLRGL